MKYTRSKSQAVFTTALGHAFQMNPEHRSEGEHLHVPIGIDLGFGGSSVAEPTVAHHSYVIDCLNRKPCLVLSVAPNCWVRLDCQGVQMKISVAYLRRYETGIFHTCITPSRMIPVAHLIA